MGPVPLLAWRELIAFIFIANGFFYRIFARCRRGCCRTDSIGTRIAFLKGRKEAP
jgi:hypothetical protein